MAYKSYPFYVVTRSGKIASGWEYREDAKDFVRDNPGHGLKIVTRAAAKKAGAVTWATNSNPFGAAPSLASRRKARFVRYLGVTLIPDMNRSVRPSSFTTVCDPRRDRCPKKAATVRQEYRQLAKHFTKCAALVGAKKTDRQFAATMRELALKLKKRRWHTFAEDAKRCARYLKSGR